MKTPRILKNLSLSALALAGAASSNAALVVYEPFGMASGSLSGQATSGIGLSGNWSSNDSVNVTAVNPDTLNHGSLANSGGQANVLPENGGNNASATTDSDLENAGLLANGATLWFSVVVDIGTTGNQHSGFGFGTAAVNGNFSGLQMSGGDGVGIYSKGAGIQATGWNSGAISNGNSFNVATDSTQLLVGKIEWGALDTDSETITLYNPSLSTLALPDAGSTVSIAAFDQTALNIISFSHRGTDSADPFIFDEIRFGDSYAAVTPVPEPSAALLGAIGFLALLRRRR